MGKASLRVNKAQWSSRGKFTACLVVNIFKQKFQSNYKNFQLDYSSLLYQCLKYFQFRIFQDTTNEDKQHYSNSEIQLTWFGKCNSCPSIPHETPTSEVQVGSSSCNVPPFSLLLSPEIVSVSRKFEIF